MLHVRKYPTEIPSEQVNHYRSTKSLRQLNGTADYLHLQKSGINIELKDVDIELTTKDKEKDVLERWLQVLTQDYKLQYGDCYGLYVN